MMNKPKVFISYSHEDSTYENKMITFANKLREESIDANIDLYEPVPLEGWPKWMENQIINSDYVIIVCSKSYWDKCHSAPSKGISWEVILVYQLLYDEYCLSNKFIPVIWNHEDAKYILLPIKGQTYYCLESEHEFQRLVSRIHQITLYTKPELGLFHPGPGRLPPKEKMTSFVSKMV